MEHGLGFASLSNEKHGRGTTQDEQSSTERLKQIEQLCYTVAASGKVKELSLPRGSCVRLMCRLDTTRPGQPGVCAGKQSTDRPQ